jgi:hypothetical protein
MNQFFLGALATTAISATGLASDTEWSELDRELAAYNGTSLTLDSSGPYMSGWFIGSIVSVSDVDRLGTGVNAGRINLHGDLGDSYSYKLGFDFFDTAELWIDRSVGVPAAAPSTAGITDAYVDIGFAEGVSVTIGGFRPVVTMSNSIDRNHTLFINRSLIGRSRASRDAGVGVNFGWDRISGQITLTNGDDGALDQHAYTVHADMDILGSSSGYEGAYGAADGTNLNVGVTYGSDEATDDSEFLALYANLVTGGLSVFGEMIDQGAGIGHNSPYTVGAGYMFGERYEAALRWNDLDNVAGTTTYDVGLNYYVQGHDLKWQLNYNDGDSDVFEYVSTISVGIAAGF